MHNSFVTKTLGKHSLFGTSGITDETDFGLAEIAVAPTYEEDFTNALSARGFNYTTVIADLAT